MFIGREEGVVIRSCNFTSNEGFVKNDDYLIDLLDCSIVHII